MNIKNNSLLVLLSFLLIKAGKIFVVLKALKYTKYVLTVLSMGISSLFYGLTYHSWTFGVGLVLLIFIHEIGHVIAASIKKMKVSAPVFIPFFGALILAEKAKDRDTEAYVGYGGPLIGSLGAVMCIAIALFTEDIKTSNLFHLLGYVGLLVNLFNMIPARPLDGGRVLHVLGNGVVYVGLTILLALSLITNDSILIFVSLFVVYEGGIICRRTMSLLMAIFFFYVSVFFFLETTLENGTMYAIYLSITMFFCLLFIICVYNLFNEEDKYHYEDSEEDTVPNIKIAGRWALAYVALVVSIFAVMSWHSQYLPKEVKEHSIVKFVA